jgi:hypothetical protein
LKGKKTPWCTEVSAAHVALAVWYKPLGGLRFLRLPALTAVEGLELFSQFPERQTFLRERERERERERARAGLRDPPKLSCGGGGGMLLEDRPHQSAR